MHYIPDQRKKPSGRSVRNKEVDQLAVKVATGSCRVGPEAAREIARKVEDQHGFWDYEERRAARRRDAVLYDFHGTLADVTGIRSLLAERKYDEFYRRSLSCPPIENVVEAARKSHEDGYVNLLFTGMPENFFDGLSAWFAERRVPVDYIDMRKAGDFRKDFIVKREMYFRATDTGYYVVRAWEDNPRVADLWSGQAIPVSLVPGWDESPVVGGVDKQTGAS